jgi:hypothetical protein
MGVLPASGAARCCLKARAGCQELRQLRHVFEQYALEAAHAILPQSHKIFA